MKRVLIILFSIVVVIVVLFTLVLIFSKREAVAPTTVNPPSLATGSESQ